MKHVIMCLIAIGEAGCLPRDDFMDLDATAAPSGRCDSAAPFDPPTLVAGVDLNTAAADFNGRLLGDERTLYFSRCPTTGLDCDIYETTSKPEVGGFNAPVLAGVSIATAHEFHPAPDVDGMRMFFVSNRADAVGGYDVYVAPMNGSGTFGPAVPVPGVNSVLDDGGVYYVEGRALWLSRSGNGRADIYRAEEILGGFAVATVVPELDDEPLTGGEASPEGTPVVSADETTVYFSSVRTGDDSDIFVATRASTSERFGATMSMSALNSAGWDEPSWLSPDGCTLYLASTRAGTWDLYVARRATLR